jgi:hypothetical protein
MPSTLERLFAYARTQDSDPRENFTTEALAGAIRSDPRPLLYALARKGLFDPDDVVQCHPFTQVSFAGAGTIDLLVQLEMGTGAHEVWIEAKVDAPESGQQLRNYRTFIDSHRELPRHLVVLAKDVLPSTVPHTPLRWREISQAARELARDNLLWSDLRAYLEAIGMTDRSTYPVSLREAASLDDAFGMLQKALAVIKAVNERLPGLGYPDWLHTSQAGRTGWITTKVHDQFTRFGRMMIYDKGELRGKVFYGFQPQDGEAYATIWIEVDPRRTAEREAVQKLARAGLNASWEQPLDHRWQLVIRRERAIAFGSEREAVDWFLGRFDELREAGLIDLLPNLGTVPPEERDAQLATEELPDSPRS